jgi:hypothetical protein
MRARIHVSPWGVHSRARMDAQTALERWWTEVERILLHDDGPPRGAESRVGGAVASAERVGGERRQAPLR